MKFTIFLVLCFTLIKGFPGVHVGNGMVSPNDLTATWNGREAYYDQLIKSGKLDKGELQYIQNLKANLKKEPAKLKFTALTGKGFYKASDKVGSPIVFNKAKLGQNKSKNTKDALLLILEAQAKRYKNKIDFKKLSDKVKKVIK